MAPPDGGGRLSGNPTPLPKGPFIAIVLMYFTNSLGLTVLFPFVAFMVKSFNVVDDVSKLGYYVGLIGSAAFLGAFFSSIFWGFLSDHIGRKPVILLGIAVNIVSSLLFGLSTNLTMAITTRLIGGLFNSVAPTARTCVAELCDRSNQSKGFSILGTMFGVGLLLGPAIGGFLCEPASKYPGFFPPFSIFATFPYLLPCFTLSMLNLISLVTTIILLPETLGRNHNKQGPPRSQPPIPPEVQQKAGDQTSEELRKPLLGDTEKAEGSEQVTASPLLQESMFGRVRRVLLRQNAIVATLLFSVLVFISAAFNEVFPLWCVTPWERGGLSWGTNLVGLAQTCSGLALIPLQMFVYAPLVGRVGPVAALRLALTIALVVLLFPVARVFGEGTFGLVISICLLQALRSFPQSGFTSCYILLAQCVENPRDLGFMNGASQTVSVFFQVWAPESSSSLFAWLAGVNGSVVNPNLWFVCIFFFYALMFVLTFFLTGAPPAGAPGAPRKR